MSPSRNDTAASAVGRLAAGLSDRPWAALAMVLALLGVAVRGIMLPAPQDTLQDDAAWEEARVTREEFDLDWDAGFVALFGDVSAVDAEEALRGVESALEALPWIAEVGTPFDVPGLREKSLAEASENPLVSAAFMNEGGMLLPYEYGEELAGPLPDDWSTQAKAAAEAAVEGLGFEVGFSGLSEVVAAQGSAFESERWRFMGFGALLGFLIASGAFRNVRATFLAGLPPLVGVVLSIGLARAVGLGADGFTTIVLPLLVLTIGFADSLHIVVAMVKARRDGAASGGEAASVALRSLAWPCLLTSLTTAIGFASLATAGHTLVVEFGLSCALSTAVTFVTVILVIPLLARTPLGACLEKVAPPQFEAEGDDAAHPGGPVARLIDRMISATLRAPRAVALLGLVLTAGSVWIASGIQADRMVMTDLAEGSEAAETLTRVDAELGGVFPVQVRLDWKEGASSEELLAASRAAEEALGAEPLIAGVLGPSVLLRSLGPELPWLSLALVPERWRQHFVDLDDRRALVAGRIQDAGSRQLIPAFERVRERLAEASTEAVELRLVGDHIAYLETVDEVTQDLGRSLALAAILILVTLAFAFRSWRLGLASMVPNLLPLGVSAAGLRFLGGHVDVSTLTALTLSLGIATDDTIHVLARWESTRLVLADAAAAARAAVLRTLPALTMTTLTLTAAFGQLLTSALPTIRDFGLLAGITLVVAFLADALLLPAILVVLDRGQKP